MKIAVEGCCHGELDKIYETLQFIENTEKVKVGFTVSYITFYVACFSKI